MPLRHVGFFLAPSTLPPPDGDWRLENELSSLDRDYDNLFAALTWARKAGEADQELRLACALAPYWWARAQLREGAQWLEDVLRRTLDADPVLRVRALNEAGMMMRQQGEQVRAAQPLDEAVSLARTAEDARLLGESLVNLASARVGVSEAEDAEARSLIQEALAIFQRSDDRWGRAVGQIYLALIELLDGQGQAAEALLLEARASFDALGDIRTSAAAVILLAHADALQGDQNQARSYLTTSLQLCRGISQRHLVATIVDLTAWLEREEHPTGAAVLVGASDAMRDTGFARTGYARHLYTQTMRHLRDRMDKRDLASARQEGQSWSFDRTVDRLLAVLEAETPPGIRVEIQAQEKQEPELNEREREVLRLMSEGMSNNQIAAAIFVSPGTVKLDIRSIYQKFGIHNRAQAIAVAVARGLI